MPYSKSVHKPFEEKTFKVAIYGGNGFVGTHIAKALAAHDVCTVCLSRTGHKPLHLKDQAWSEKVRWCKGDASKPQAELLRTIDVVIISVGSPPLPTFSREAYEHQVFMNGVTNVNAILAAGKAGVKRIVLIGAQIPIPMRSDRFGYTKGKRLALQAAQEFCELSAEHQAVVLQAGAIYGTRHLANGRALPLSLLMKPLSYVLPWQFISVEKIAQRVADETLNQDLAKPALTVLKNIEI